MNFFSGPSRNPATLRKKKKEVLSFTATGFMATYGKDIVIEPSEAAAEAIRAHPQCPFQNFRWAGEFSSKNDAGEFTWYYVAGNGSLHTATTQVIVLAK